MSFELLLLLLFVFTTGRIHHRAIDGFTRCGSPVIGEELSRQSVKNSDARTETPSETKRRLGARSLCRLTVPGSLFCSSRRVDAVTTGLHGILPRTQTHVRGPHEETNYDSALPNVNSQAASFAVDTPDKIRAKRTFSSLQKRTSAPSMVPFGSDLPMLLLRCLL